MLAKITTAIIVISCGAVGACAAEPADVSTNMSRKMAQSNMVQPDGLGPDGEDAYRVRCDALRANEFQPNQFRVLCPYTPEDIRTLERARGACPPKHQWVCCAAQAVAKHRAACEPDCKSRHHTALLDDVASFCGGSEVQEGGGMLLIGLWTEAGHRGTQRGQHTTTVIPAQEKVHSLAEAQDLAAQALLDDPFVCPRLFLPFDSGTQALVNGRYYLRVRCHDDAHLVIVDEATAAVSTMTCRQARETIGNFCYTMPP